MAYFILKWNHQILEKRLCKMLPVSSVILVLRMTRYSFTDENTGELRQGVTVTYCTDWENARGLEIAKATLPYAEWQDFVLPARCNADFDISVNGKGQMQLKLKHMDFVAPLALRDK